MSFISNLFGSGSAPQINYTPSGFTGGGLKFSGGKLTESASLKSQVGGLQSTFGQQAGEIGKLASTVAPGFSNFRKAGLSDIENSRLSTTSNLRDNLAQRRILGS